jgi:hypothetical protein
VKFVISKRARRHIEKIQAWWAENRPAAPALFLDELAGVVRRVLMTRTSHHLYYRYLPDREELTVLAVWGAPKERGPKL